MALFRWWGGGLKFLDLDCLLLLHCGHFTRVIQRLQETVHTWTFCRDLCITSTIGSHRTRNSQNLSRGDKSGRRGEYISIELCCCRPSSDCHLERVLQSQEGSWIWEGCPTMSFGCHWLLSALKIWCLVQRRLVHRVHPRRLFSAVGLAAVEIARK